MILLLQVHFGDPKYIHWTPYKWHVKFILEYAVKLSFQQRTITKDKHRYKNIDMCQYIWSNLANGCKQDRVRNRRRTGSNSTKENKI